MTCPQKDAAVGWLNRRRVSGRVLLSTLPYIHNDHELHFRRSKQAGGFHPVSYPQFFLLTYLASEDFLSMSSIAQKMGHSTAAATGMVDKLQEMGYLKRMSAAKDRRKIMVAITQEGRDLVARMRQNIVRDLAALMAGADPDARQTLADTGKSIRKRRLA